MHVGGGGGDLNNGHFPMDRVVEYGNYLWTTIYLATKNANIIQMMSLIIIRRIYTINVRKENQKPKAWNKVLIVLL